MKIHIDLQVLQSPAANRGMGRYSYELTKALLQQPRNHDFSLSINKNLKDNLGDTIASLRKINPTIPVNSYIPTTTDWPVTEAQQYAIALNHNRLMQAIKPDIFHACNQFEFEHWGFQTTDHILKTENKNHTAILYDLIPNLYPEKYLSDDNAKQFYTRKTQSLKSMDGLLAISNSAKNDAHKLLNIPNINIYNIGGAAFGEYDLDQISPNDRREVTNKYTIQKPFILYTSGPDYRKNTEGLIEAFSLLPIDIRSSHQLVIVMELNGVGHKEQLEKVAKKFGLFPSEMVLTGFVSDHDLKILYNTCKVFTFASLYEGFGMPILEALHCGAAVLVGNNSSQTEIIDNPEAWFDASNPKNMSEVIYKSLTNTDFRKKLKEYAMKRAETFTWKKVAEKTLDAWEDIYNRNNKANITNIPFSYDEAEHELKTMLHEKPIGDVDKINIIKLENKLLIKKRYLIDTTQTNILDVQSGIQRVVRNICKNFNFDNIEIYLVYLNNSKLFYCENMSLLCGLRSEQSGEVVIHENDTLLMLDSSWEFIDKFIPIFNEIRYSFGRVISVVYDTIPIMHPSFFVPIMQKTFPDWLEKAISNSDAVLCISKDVANCVALLIEERAWKHSHLNIGYFHLGAELESDLNIDDHLKNEINLPFDSQKPLFLLVSTIEPRKGHDIALTAMEQLWSQGFEYQLCFIGKTGWQMEAFCNSLANHTELNRRLFWLEGVSDSVLKATYKQSTALLFPSVAEGFGLGIVESAQFGAQVICSDIPVFREIAEGGATFVNREDIGAWMAAIQNAADGKLESDSKNIKTISWKSSALQVLDFLQNPLGNQHVKTLPSSVSENIIDFKTKLNFNESKKHLDNSTRLISNVGRKKYFSKSGLGKNVSTEMALTDVEYVAALYHTILQRPYDAVGMEYHCDNLINNLINRSQLLFLFINSAEAKSLNH